MIDKLLNKRPNLKVNLERVRVNRKIAVIMELTRAMILAASMTLFSNLRILRRTRITQMLQASMTLKNFLSLPTTHRAQEMAKIRPTQIEPTNWAIPLHFPAKNLVKKPCSQAH